MAPFDPGPFCYHAPMCGRFSLIDSTVQIEHRFGGRLTTAAFETASGAHSGPYYNAAPSMHLPIIIEREGQREMVLARWGFQPAWASQLPAQANARFDTAHEKKMFHEAFAHRHCLIPANSFFEWRREKGIKQPYRIMVHEGELFAMAGIWEPPSFPDTMPNFAVLTTDANSLMQKIHDRMPVILSEKNEGTWLEGGKEAAIEIQYPSEEMQMYPVSTKVNKVSFQDKDALAPVAEPSLGI